MTTPKMYMTELRLEVLEHLKKSGVTATTAELAHVLYYDTTKKDLELTISVLDGLYRSCGAVRRSGRRGKHLIWEITDNGKKLLDRG